MTVKTRIGIDDRDRYEDLVEFVEAIAAVGCRTVIIHARKAWLTGLSPKENREIPPLRYDVVYRLKHDFAALEIIVNGGITSLDEAVAHNDRVDGAMLGREAYRNPFVLAEADRRIFGAGEAAPDRVEVAQSMLAYAHQELERGTRLHHVTRHMLGLFHGDERCAPLAPAPEHRGRAPRRCGGHRRGVAADGGLKRGVPSGPITRDPCRSRCNRRHRCGHRRTRWAQQAAPAPKSRTWCTMGIRRRARVAPRAARADSRRRTRC